VGGMQPRGCPLSRLAAAQIAAATELLEAAGIAGNRLWPSGGRAPTDPLLDPCQPRPSLSGAFSVRPVQKMMLRAPSH
jgi:hypothetical protein